MIVLYNSDSFAVMQVDLPDLQAGGGRSGIEIVDKAARKGIFLDGEVARLFSEQVQALAQEEDIDSDDIDAHLARYTGEDRQAQVLH